MPYFEVKVKVHVGEQMSDESLRIGIEECLDTAMSSGRVLEIKRLDEEED